MAFFYNGLNFFLVSGVGPLQTFTLTGERLCSSTEVSRFRASGKLQKPCEESDGRTKNAKKQQAHSKPYNRSEP
jgi:hypothetical protein